MASLTVCGLPSTTDPTASVSRRAYSAKPAVSSGLGASGRGTGGAAVTGGAPRAGSASQQAGRTFTLSRPSSSLAQASGKYSTPLLPLNLSQMLLFLAP